MPVLPLAAVAVAWLSAGCSSDEAGGATLNGRRAAAAEAEPPKPTVIHASATPYRAQQVLSDGWVAGTVHVEGPVPADSTVRPTMDQRVCGASFVDRTIVRRGNGLGGVVVWLEGVGAGKPLPLSRRFEVTYEKCRLEPRVQAVIAGGTLNLRSRDRVEHRTRIVRHDSGTVVSRAVHNDFGQVVPDDRVLAHPGLLELRSDVHPWTRGYVAVFDHPYFAVTPPAGTFRIETVPTGSYTLVAWHERFGRIEQPVTIGAGVGTTVTLTFRAGAVAADSAARRPSGADTARPGTPEGGSS